MEGTPGAFLGECHVKEVKSLFSMKKIFNFFFFCRIAFSLLLLHTPLNSFRIFSSAVNNVVPSLLKYTLCWSLLSTYFPSLNMWPLWIDIDPVVIMPNMHFLKLFAIRKELNLYHSALSIILYNLSYKFKPTAVKKTN